MGRSYSLTTIKALFAQASSCAYPACGEPLVFEDPSRGVRSIAVQIAHIRSEKRTGPRFEAAYPKDQINAEENLLLLCGKHHTPVDQNESVFTIGELVEWKAAQVGQSGGTVVTNHDLEVLRQTLESTLSALLDAFALDVEVSAIGGLGLADRSVITTPLQGPRELETAGESPRILIGVQVVCRSAVGVEVAGAGFQFDTGGGIDSYSPWHLAGEWCQYTFPHQLTGRSAGHWLVADDTVRATLLHLGREYRVMPRRFRAFGLMGDGAWEFGAWHNILEMPFWTPEETAALKALPQQDGGDER